MKKGLPEGTGPPKWTQQPQISVSLQEGGGGCNLIFGYKLENAIKVNNKKKLQNF